MKLTTKGRYAIIAMVDVAMHAQSVPINLRKISTRQNISLSYLEQLFSKLKNNSIVKSVRGPGGGYILSRPSHSINLLEIITAVDENIDQTQCGGAKNCNSNKPCLTHTLWINLTIKINDHLKNILLSDLVKSTRKEFSIHSSEIKNVSEFRE